MTSASRMPGSGEGPDEHPEVSEISDLAEGLLDPEHVAELRAHLARCELCADVLTSLEEIRSALGTLPGPVRMPDDVAGRIDAALAAEALLDSTAPAGRPTESGARNVSRETEGARDENARTVGSRAEGDRPVGGHAADNRLSRDRAADGRRPGGRPAGHGSAATGPERRPARHRWRTALLATAGVAAVFGLGSVIVQQTTPSSGGGDAESGVAQENSAKTALEQRVQKLLDRQDASMGDQQQPPTSEGERSPTADAPLIDSGLTLPSCIREGIGRSEKPLAVDPASPYRGRPAYLVVLPHSGDGERVDAYVVDSACTTGSQPGPGEVLQKHTLPRD